MISAVKKVSYVISIHNGFETFQYTLPIILREFNREIAQLIIIDNASTDGLKDITSTFWDNSGVEYIRCNNKLKFGDALSEGIALAKGEWICYLGDDDLVNFSVFAMYQQHFEYQFFFYPIMQAHYLNATSQTLHCELLVSCFQ